ncbi:hypothetical protein SOCEGT47_051030 [Sorangium cellulosum]|uniref:Uncharacterized protein n=1 Tax=Sorangium cellulosum TaxID=56 RepID=A0A4P2Q594_SORCE|nr:hypothetical protein [Sorangium cellulosum]AUX24565.1 hypothetical protein SOCEGT47_051030 [Sorangium cellulosum]
MVAKSKSSEPAPQAQQKHPDELQRDLNPNHMAGQNIGAGPSTLDPQVKLASDIEELTRELQDFTADELREIPVLPAGARLLQDAVHVDLADPERRAFRATAQRTAGPEQHLVPKADVPHMVWNRLVRVSDPQRLQ